MTIAPADTQQSLFYIEPNIHCDSNASARNAYGMAAQEIVCRTLGINPIRINGNFDICFDAHKDDMFYEIKSVHKNSKIVLYDWRAKKEKSASVKLKYAILVHTLRNARVDILQAMLLSAAYILVQDACIIHSIAKDFPLKKIRPDVYKNPRNGYARKGYVDGYRNIPLTTLLTFPHQKFTPK